MVVTWFLCPVPMKPVLRRPNCFSQAHQRVRNQNGRGERSDELAAEYETRVTFVPLTTKKIFTFSFSSVEKSKISLDRRLKFSGSRVQATETHYSNAGHFAVTKKIRSKHYKQQKKSSFMSLCSCWSQAAFWSRPLHCDFVSFGPSDLVSLFRSFISLKRRKILRKFSECDYSSVVGRNLMFRNTRQMLHRKWANFCH